MGCAVDRQVSTEGLEEVDSEKRDALRPQGETMKDTARILKFKGEELRTPTDVIAVCEALIADLLSGEITPAEHRKIQQEIVARTKEFGSMVKIFERLKKKQHRASILIGETFFL